jgi:tetratricopeptide (TPR) repeat protein
MMRPAPIALAALIVAALAATAAAQPPRGTRASAAARFKQGQAFFKASDYDHALIEFEAAYELSHEPALIFNIALCHDRAKRPVEALAMFQRYLALVPGGDLADEAREDVARLVPIVEAMRARDQAAAAELADQQRQAAAARAAEAAARVDRERERREAARAVRVQRTDLLERRARLERWTGIAGGALGAISLGVGVKYGLDARSAARFITDHQGMWHDAELVRDAEGRAAQTRMIWFTSLGGAAVIGGGILYLLGRRDDGEASRLRLEVQAAPAGASVTLAGQF